VPEEEKREHEEELDVPSFEDEEIEKALEKKATGGEEKKEEKEKEEEEEAEEVIPRISRVSGERVEEIDFEMMRRILSLPETRKQPIFIQLLRDHVWVEKVIRTLGWYSLFYIWTTFGQDMTTKEVEALLKDPDQAAQYLKAFLDEVFELYKRGGGGIRQIATEAIAVKVLYEFFSNLVDAYFPRLEALLARAIQTITVLKQKLEIALSLMDPDQKLEYIRKVRNLGLTVDEVVTALGEYVETEGPENIQKSLEELRRSLYGQ